MFKKVEMQNENEVQRDAKMQKREILKSCIRGLGQR
jgi:hypothetical protein